MNYEEMSDFEINKLVASNTFGSHEWVCVSSGSDGEFVAKLVNYTQEKFDPCNNPSDAFPIITEYKIGISPIGDKWMANNFNPSSVGDYQVQTMHYDESPLRAAMICFLKMKDGE